jgi:hypothetical protein
MQHDQYTTKMATRWHHILFFNFSYHTIRLRADNISYAVTFKTSPPSSLLVIKRVHMTHHIEKFCTLLSIFIFT